jgi:hypothetical protein
MMSLRDNKGNFDSPMTLSHQSNLELMWWVNNIHSAFKPILQSTPAVILTTDASTLGWGAVLGDTRTGGPWDQTEQQYRINCLDMRALLLGLRSLCKHVSSQFLFFLFLPHIM